MLSTKINLPSVAVLLAAYNGMQYIEEQVQSILQQTGVNVSIFISVDLSTDGTYVWAVDAAQRHDNVHLLEYGARFGGAARNFFRLLRDVDISQFDFVSFADQDDIWRPDKLTRAVAKIWETGSQGYSSNVTAFWPSGKTKLIDKSQPQRSWDYLFEAAGPGCTYVFSSGLASQLKSVIVANWSLAGGLDLHDWFSYAFARANGYRWVIDDWSSMLYRQHLGNQWGANSGWRAFLFRIQKVAGGWGFEQSALTAQLAGQGGSPFVRSWSRCGRLGFLKLALRAYACRRRLRDRIFFFFACFLLAVLGKKQ